MNSRPALLLGACVAVIAPLAGVAQSPAPRSGHAAAYDPIRKRVVVFGGGVDGAVPYPRDSWGWDGTRWALLSADGPPGRDDGIMEYDPLSKALLLYGGRTFANRTPSFRTDTWTFDGKWTLRDTMGVGVREHSEIVVDHPAAGPLLIGGVATDRPATLADAWRWNGSAWKLVAAPRLDRTVLDGAVAIAAYGVVSVAVALDSADGTGLASTRVLHWTGSAWLPADSARGPAISPKVPVTAGPLPGTLVLFDQFPPNRVTSTWIWRRGSWAKVAGEQPPARRGAAMVYDPGRKRVVLIGGDTGDKLLADVWEFDGTTWTRVL